MGRRNDAEKREEPLRTTQRLTQCLRTASAQEAEVTAPHTVLTHSECSEAEVKVLVVRWCLALCHRMDCSPPGSSVHGILQARILEWVAVLQGTFPIQALKLGVLLCWQTLLSKPH